MKKSAFSKILGRSAAGLVLLLPTLVWADTARLAGDTFINPGDGNAYGALPTVTVGSATSSKGLLLFDLATLPSTTGVAWARLRVYVNTVNTGGTLDLGIASGPWAEASVTGNSGVGVGSVLATAAVSKAGYVTFDVTTQVAAWLSGSPNNGLTLTADTGTPALSLIVDSKENPATSHPAVLEVVFGGTAGAMGPQGAPGAAGAAGTPGAAGVAGPAGATGPSGPSGPAGALGVAGPAGANGATGAAGPAGAAGAAGAVGAAGPAGATGATGAFGPSGPSGAVGVAGPQGPQGATGAPGPAGAAGAAGAAFSNLFSVNPGTGSYTISNSNTSSIFFTTNNSTVTMPTAASMTGKKIWIAITNPGGGNFFTVATQGGDALFTPQTCPNDEPPACTGKTSLTFQNSVQFYSDGARWNSAYTNQ